MPHQREQNKDVSQLLIANIIIFNRLSVAEQNREQRGAIERLYVDVNIKGDYNSNA